VSKRTNIILPETTLKVLDRVAPKSKRSLKGQLKPGYQANSERSREIACEWFPLEEEAWRKASK
jgi:hypothetical protein